MCGLRVDCADNACFDVTRNEAKGVLFSGLIKNKFNSMPIN